MELGCDDSLWVAYMSGYGGINIVFLPNDMVYYYFSDGGSQLVIAGPGSDVHFATLSPAVNAELGAYDRGGFYQSHCVDSKVWRRSRSLAEVPSAATSSIWQAAI